MIYRFVTQRDLDGTWSVREVANNSRAICRGKLLAGLTEKVAALNARNSTTDLSPLTVQSHLPSTVRPS